MGENHIHDDDARRCGGQVRRDVPALNEDCKLPLQTGVYDQEHNLLFSILLTSFFSKILQHLQRGHLFSNANRGIRHYTRGIEY